LFKDGEDTSHYVKAEGIITDVGFHPGRIEAHQPEIMALLAELPTEFHIECGGGGSFLNACYDKHGNQWTGMHQRMEQLFQLGIGVGAVKCLLPREIWKALPGGMPYYSVWVTEQPPTVVVLEDIADAFGMRGLPNTIIVKRSKE
jgi:hypothetical protein